MINKNQLLNKEYRPEINGLRAVAVILVILFHLEYDWIQGGYLGVDVFLVISGYLISRNILADLALNKFSFKKFYTKRFKRLFPALFFTLALSLLIGFLIFSPSNLERLGKSVLSSIFSVANFFFLSEKGYFDLESGFKPLLHIWSLSLEEQFYFIWPLLLFGIHKIFRQQLFYVIAGIVILSLVLCSVYISDSPEAVFFLLPFRFFEFLLGALCIWFERYKIENKIFREFSLILGLGLIIYSSLSFTALTPMPGLLSLIPCIGAMLVIYMGKDTLSSWLLKNKLFEIIGKSSYSIYLIHWPIIVYYKYWTLTDLTNTHKIIMGVASLLLGFLMWKYIENSFRFSKAKFKKVDLVWIWMPALMLLLSLASINVWTNKGYASRYPEQFTFTHEEIQKHRSNYWSDSNTASNFLKVNSDKNIIVMGNSHAVDLIYALRNNGLDANITSLRTSVRCYNFGTPLKSENAEECLRLKTKNFENTNWATIDAIYLHDHWPKKDLPNLKKMLRQIRKLSDAPIYVFGPKMTFERPVSDIVHSSRSFSPQAINSYAQKFTRSQKRRKLNKTLNRYFKSAYFKDKSIHYIDILNIQGGRQKRFNIISQDDSEFLYFDNSHFTEKGATELGRKLKEKKPFLFNVANFIKK